MLWSGEISRQLRDNEAEGSGGNEPGPRHTGREEAGAGFEMVVAVCALCSEEADCGARFEKGQISIKCVGAVQECGIHYCLFLEI